MNTTQLISLLKTIKGTTFATIVCEVEPDLIAGSHLKGKLKKQVKVNCALGFNYANSINRLLGQQGKPQDFQPKLRIWGIRLPKTTLVEHKGKYYLETKTQKVLYTKYFVEKREVSYDEIKDQLKPKKNYNPVGLRDYKIESIKEIKMHGKLIKIG